MVIVAKRPASSGFGDRLRVLRNDKGMTQANLAAKLGLTPQAIAKYEQGGTEPTWPVVLRLAEALGVSVTEFIPAEGAAAEARAAEQPEPPPRPRGKRK
jgi:transcriptional regulator with XRE-family HTH domain